MHHCNHHQSQMLEHLYGLLDDAESRPLLDHLAGCPVCQSALEKARHQQRLFAAAARQEFPGVRFEPPADEPAPVALPLPAPAERDLVRRGRRWGRWAVAAALLIAAGGLGTPAAYFGHDYLQARSAVAAHADQVADAERALAEVNHQVARLPVEKNQQVEDVWKAARARQLNVVVSGPQRVQVGAPSEYRIQTRNLDGRPVAARLDVRVVDQHSGKTVLEENDVKSAGEYQLTLQPSLPLLPEAALALDVKARREGDADASSSLQEHLELVAPVYVTHLATDRPMYQVGDTVHFRSLTLERFSLKPPPDDFRLAYSITKPSGEKSDILAGTSRLVADPRHLAAAVNGPDGRPLRGLGTGDYLLDGAEGGEYTLTVHEMNDRFPPQQRKFIVNRYQASALNKELNFDHSSYGPGETVVARLKVMRTNGEPAAECLATPQIFIDGQVYGIDGQANGKSASFKVSNEGKVDVKFRLPSAIERGQASLAVSLQDGPVPDTIVRNIPVVAKSLQVEFYPEGGDLIAGVENRVYFQVRTTLDRPGDLRGQLIDDSGKKVVDDVHTLTDADSPGVNQGMGVFAFRPDPARKYRLNIESPLGITSKHELPAAKADGVAMKVLDGVTSPADPIRVRVCSPRAERALLVGAYCRGRLLDHQRVTARAGDWTEVALNPARAAGGVYRVTVFEELPGAERRSMRPWAERLVYRQPGQRLKLDIHTDKTDYIPGDHVTLNVTARDEQDRPTGAVVLLSVVDQRTLKMADEKTARSMPTHFLLTTEVRKPEDLEHADFLLSDGPKAREALDLLLGTQGWRRFAEQDPARFRKEHRDDAERLLVTIGQSSSKVHDFAQEQAQKVAQDFDDRIARTQTEQASASTGLATLRADTAAREAAERVRRYEDWMDHYGRPLLPVAGLALFGVLLVALFLALPRPVTRSVPFAVGAVVGALGVFALALLPLLSRLKVEETTRLAAGMANRDEALLRAEAGGKAMPVRDPTPMGAAPVPPGPPAVGGMAPPADRPPAERPAAPPAPKAMKPAPPAKAEEKAKAPEGADRNAQQQLGKRAADKDRGRDMLDGLRKNLPDVERAGGDLRQMREQGLEFGLDARRRLMDQMLGGGMRGGGAARGGLVAPLPPFLVREYAHKNQAAGQNGIRTDFAETLLWQPALVVPTEGRTTIAFDLCDSVTTFDVSAAGHTLDGRLGTGSAAVLSRLPFTLDPKTPIEVSSADRIDLPLTVSNNTVDSRAVRLSATATGLRITGDGKDDRLTLAGNSAARRVYRLEPSLVEGEARVEFRGKTEPFAADSIARTFRIVPDGFPVVAAKSDLLEGTALNDVVLPDAWVKGTLKCRADIYPSTLATLTKGLEGLLREPNGCFEQTSTSNYPNVLILDYLKETDQVRPEVEAHARDLLSRGYQKLTSFECPKTANNSKQGYEWFGAPDGAHEALTAYGLLEFRDMARVYKVDAAMLERTRQGLLAARDGQGGFQRNPRALDTFGRAPQDVTNAYIVWALTESGKDDDVSKELDALRGQAKTSKDPYFVSLVANSLLNRDRAAEAVALLKAVVGWQKVDGHLDAEKTSITGSGGRDLQIETTALAVLGWLKANRPAEFTLPIEKSVKWIGQQRGGYGGFGSTQSTILALKALIAHARANKKTAQAGEITLLVGDVRVGQKDFPAGAQDVLTVEMPDPEKYLKPGSNKVRVAMSGRNSFPYTLTWSYQTLKPVSAEGCAVRLATKLNRAKATEGEAVRLTATLENVTDQGHGMAVAIVGLPAGLSLPEDLKQLKDHARLRENGTKPGLISTFEVRSRELILYWRDLAPRQKIEVPIDLVCRVPGEYRGPASRAYLYYNADVKHWVEPLTANVAAKE
jgi:hypothetical protein